MRWIEVADSDRGKRPGLAPGCQSFQQRIVRGAASRKLHQARKKPKDEIDRVVGPGCRSARKLGSKSFAEAGNTKMPVNLKLAGVVESNQCPTQDRLIHRGSNPGQIQR